MGDRRVETMWPRQRKPCLALAPIHAMFFGEAPSEMDATQLSGHESRMAKLARPAQGLKQGFQVHHRDALGSRRLRQHSLGRRSMRRVRQNFRVREARPGVASCSPEELPLDQKRLDPDGG